MLAADKDLYLLLDLKSTADSKDIRAAYRRAALVAHPDKGGTKEAFHAIKLAFEVLSCSTTRHLYNQSSIQQLVQRRRRSPASFGAAKCKLPRSSLDKGLCVKTRPKRSFSYSNTAAPQPKRHRCNETMDAGTRRGPSVHSSSHEHSQYKAPVMGAALENMRSLLQSMTAQQRLSAIQNVSSDVRVALLSFMQNPQNTQRLASQTGKPAMPAQGRKHMWRPATPAALSGVRTITSSLGTRYRAHLVIRGLRLYINTSDYEAAIDHHIMLVQMRDAVGAESFNDPCIWTKPEKLLCIMTRILTDSNSSETPIELHVFVYMRASPWLDKNTYIVSPVMDLARATSLYAQLLSAHLVSWEALRAEWLQLLQVKQRFQARGLSHTDAETIVDQAREKALLHHFKQAERRVKSAMKCESLEAKKACALVARESRRLAIEKERVVALERKATKQRRQMWQARQKWLPQSRWRDMTMEDIMLNTYLHL